MFLPGLTSGKSGSEQSSLKKKIKGPGEDKVKRKHELKREKLAEAMKA